MNLDISPQRLGSDHSDPVPLPLAILQRGVVSRQQGTLHNNTTATYLSHPSCSRSGGGVKNKRSLRLSAPSLPTGGTLRLSRNDQRYAMVTCLLRVHACMQSTQTSHVLAHTWYPQFIQLRHYTPVVSLTALLCGRFCVAVKECGMFTILTLPHFVVSSLIVLTVITISHALAHPRSSGD
jgi:hypothetical protein